MQTESFQIQDRGQKRAGYPGLSTFCNAARAQAVGKQCFNGQDKQPSCVGCEVWEGFWGPHIRLVQAVWIETSEGSVRTAAATGQRITLGTVLFGSGYRSHRSQIRGLARLSRLQGSIHNRRLKRKAAPAHRRHSAPQLAARATEIAWHGHWGGMGDGERMGGRFRPACQPRPRAEGRRRSDRASGDRGSWGDVGRPCEAALTRGAVASRPVPGCPPKFAAGQSTFRCPWLSFDTASAASLLADDIMSIPALWLL
jgi:hypothetical protein